MGSPSEAGSASVLGAVICCVVMATGLVAFQHGMVMAMRARVTLAADLAAAAGASRLDQPDQQACRQAEVVAAANGARLISCTASADSVWVEVSRQVSPSGGPRGAVRARAHAQVRWAS